VSRLSLTAEPVSLSEKMAQVGFILPLIVLGTAAVGFIALYSAAGGSIDPWANRQMVRFAVGFIAMLAIAMVDIRFWLQAAYPLYWVTMGLLFAVDVFGSIGMGAQRWLDLGFFQLQPSELMKIVLVLALARYFHRLSLEEVARPLSLVVPILMVLAPTALVVVQPDLGNALILLMLGGAIFFIAGVRWWKFGIVLGALGAAVPIGWEFLREYQRNRILTFLDPSRDPLGAGYHIIQSKIALGSGGVSGKGFLLGTQSHLQFLPEAQTDFIFTLIAEEWGLIGGLVVIGLYAALIGYGIAVGLRCRHHFGRFLAVGLSTNLFLYVFINMAMVMGVIPAKGVPLPLISYGGTAMLTVLFGFGLLLSVLVHKDAKLSKSALGPD
jgi:rod shape determining protein RodA